MPKLDYGTIGGKGLSYSRRGTLHACPRKFQLENIYNLGVGEDNVHFAFGHAVAAGVQSLIEHPGNINRALLHCFTHWSLGIYENLDIKKKSLWYAVRAVQQFHKDMLMGKSAILKQLEIAKFTDKEGNIKPAIELTFNIVCHDGYNYEGHVDLILYNPVTKTYLILELKTTGFNNINETMFKNSSQTIEYSVILDSIANTVQGRSA